jgi:hypothetical protein
MRRFATCLLLATCLLAGCRKTPPDTQPEKPNIEKGIRRNFPIVDQTIVLEQLREIGQGYAAAAASGQGPTKIEDVVENNKLLTAVNRGDYVVFLGVDPSRLPGKTVLAYQKEPNPQGKRGVLLCDYSVEMMDADAFAAAPKAQKGK